MQKLAVIVDYKIRKEGTTEKGPYRFNDVHIKWNEQPTGAQPYEQEVVMSVKGFINETSIKHNIAMKTLTQVTFYSNVRIWQDKKFNDITGYLPKDMMDEAPQANPQVVEPL